MKYTRIVVTALVALLMAGSADAQVSVRRQSRGNRETSNREAAKSESKPARTATADAAKKAEPKTQNSVNKNEGAVVKSASTTKKKNNTNDKAPAFADGKSLRLRNFDEYQKESQEDTPWQHVVYREIDLTVEQNASLYYPMEPQDGLTNLFRVILDAYTQGELKTYEYLGDRESFTERYITKPQEVLDKFEIPYRIEKPKGRNTAEVFAVDEIDVPSAEVLSYYVKERWEFDQKHSEFVPRILCLCPVLHRAGEAGDGKVKYPMFWINFEDLRPFMRNHLLVSSGMNNAARFNMEEFFTLYQYEGTIYKEQNLRGLTLQQQYPNPDSLKMRQKEIDEKLRGFGTKIWVEESPEADNSQGKKEKAAKAGKAEAKATDDANLVKTGRVDRRSKQEVVVDSVAIAEKATKRRSVRR